MKIKQFISLILAVLLILCCCVTAFAQTPTFSQNFETVDEMNTFIAKYSADFPDVEYSEEGITKPENYILKYKDFLDFDINDDDYILTDIDCTESAYHGGINSIFLDYEHKDGYYYADVEIFYGVGEGRIAEILDESTADFWSEIYKGEVMGYPYIVIETCDEFGCDEQSFYKIAVEDVLVKVTTNALYDKKLIENVLIEKTGILLPVYEYVKPEKIDVSDEMLSAVRADYHNDEIEKDDISIYELHMISTAKQFVRYGVSGYGVSCDVVIQYIGDYGFRVPARPLPQVLFDGVLYELKDAYEQGIVNNDDLAKISTFESRSYRLVHKNDFVGDINGDLLLDVYDATTIQRCLAGLSKLSWHNGEEYADFDGDGVVSVIDATGIKKKVAKLS